MKSREWEGMVEHSNERRRLTEKVEQIKVRGEEPRVGGNGGTQR